MVKRLRWVIIPEEDFIKLNETFYFYKVWGEEFGTELIDLAEKYKSFAADYDGKRFVFVSVRRSTNKNDSLAGFVVYDKSSKKVLLSRCSKHDVEELAYYRFILRLAMDNRFDIIETFFSEDTLFTIGYSDTNPLLTFFGLCYTHLGDEFIDYLYKNFNEIIRRLRERKIVYGRNFVFLPRIKVSYDAESVGLIRAGDGSIILFRSPSGGMIIRTKVSENEEPLFYNFFSYIIDYAEDLEKNMALYEKECDEFGCNYQVFSSASSPHWWRDTAAMLIGSLRKYSRGTEELKEGNILFIHCGGYCDIYFFGEVVDYLTIEYRTYRRYLVEDLMLMDYYKDYFPRFLEYVIAYKDKFPVGFVEDMYRYYLHRNVMNIVS